MQCYELAGSLLGMWLMSSIEERQQRMMKTLLWSCTMNGKLTSHTVDLTHWNSTHCILTTVGTMNWGTLLSLSSSCYISQLSL